MGPKPYRRTVVAFRPRACHHLDWQVRDREEPLVVHHGQPDVCLLEDSRRQPGRQALLSNREPLGLFKRRRTKPRLFDDGNLNLQQPASVKAITEVSGVDRKTMARYNASSYEKNQFCHPCSNPYDRHQEPPMAPNVSSDGVSFDIFFNIVRPSFHRDFNEEDLSAVFKRSAVVVFTEIGIYVRPPSTKKKHMKRHAWPDKDRGMVSFCARPTYHAYLRGTLSANGADDNHLQWSLNLLQAALDGEVVSSCTTIFGKSAFTGQKFIQENRPELAGIDANTIFYPDKDTSGALETESKRFKSVKSASNLLAPASSASSSAEHAKPEHEVQEHEQAGRDSFPSTVNKEGGHQVPRGASF